MRAQNLVVAGLSAVICAMPLQAQMGGGGGGGGGMGGGGGSGPPTADPTGGGSGQYTKPHFIDEKHFPEPATKKVAGKQTYEYSSSNDSTTATLELKFPQRFGKPYVTALKAVYKFAGRTLHDSPNAVDFEFTVPVKQASDVPSGESPSAVIVLNDSVRVVNPIHRSTSSDGKTITYSQRMSIEDFLQLAVAKKAGGDMDEASILYTKELLDAIRDLAAHMNPDTPATAASK